MRIGASYWDALGWATEEYFQRHQVRVELDGSKALIGDTWSWTWKDYPEDWDPFQTAEVRALVDAAVAYWRTGRAEAPDRSVFTTVPTAEAERDKAASVPWWKRIFTAEPSTPVGVPTDLLDVAEMRQINERLNALPGDIGAVNSAPVSSQMDLAQVIASAYPVTTSQVDRFKTAGITVSGGGGFDGNRILLVDMAGAYFKRIQTGFTAEESLTLAINQRNGLVARGASKSLIAAWNAEIRFLSEFVRHHPGS